ncbi:mitochondrial inner membrane protease ATP23 homolog [Eleutherodactylus coqui]|uniref:mitochondrial inner membrane protease ATP23 homolog n=1 Tax=Eleutherodactylus coqui TaxID=57060 RepID=UPI003461D2DF
MDDDKSAKDDHGYHLFPERNPRNPRKEPFLSRLYGLKTRCNARVKIALETSPHVRLLLDAMSRAGCTAYRDRHFACEECAGEAGGGFDTATSQIVMCQNKINHQKIMNQMLTHELIHAYDHCRAQVDFLGNIQHLACTEIRAASLSGDCSLSNEMLRFRFGIKQHHQTCVRDRAVRSIMASSKSSQETAEKAVDEVFDSCFNDREPFDRIPHNTATANIAYKNFRNRGRYYENI